MDLFFFSRFLTIFWVHFFFGDFLHDTVVHRGVCGIRTSICDPWRVTCSHRFRCCLCTCTLTLTLPPPLTAIHQKFSVQSPIWLHALCYGKSTMISIIFIGMFDKSILQVSFLAHGFRFLLLPSECPCSQVITWSGKQQADVHASDSIEQHPAFTFSSYMETPDVLVRTPKGTIAIEISPLYTVSKLKKEIERQGK